MKTSTAVKNESYLSEHDIATWRPDPLPADGEDLAQRLRDRLRACGHTDPRQLAGRAWAMGCVALEVTQRCNLDCTLCYLSENSESVRDVPLVELFRRIDQIRAHYGPGARIQITGGDPTLRSRADLIAIVRRIRGRDMVPSLFTNGIKATHGLLRALAACGLADVAFHVDMTQQRKGFAAECELNVVRRAYIERARGLGLGIIFNTTVFRGNFREIPDLVRFFVAHADAIKMASFQLQADTGRGVLRARDEIITPQTVALKIRQGAGAAINFDAIMPGHPSCNKYASSLVIGGRVIDLLDDTAFVTGLFARAARYRFEGRGTMARSLVVLGAVLANPGFFGRLLKWTAAKLWSIRHDIWRARGRVTKLSFFIHNFQDAERLDAERCRACVFMVATADGPISMCVHNAKRDAFILKPIPVTEPAGTKLWRPLPDTGEMRPPAGRLKGRARASYSAKGRRRA